MHCKLLLATFCAVLTAGAVAGCGSTNEPAVTGTGGSGSGGSGSGGSGSGGKIGTGGSGTGGAGTGGSAVDAPADQVTTDAGSDTPADAPAGAFMFKSAGLVMMGANLVYPPRHSAPTNVSPPMTWGTGPAGTMSYAITMFDMSINRPHFAMWDIPGTETGLPANIPHTAMPGAPAPAGMKQTDGGFQGPGGPNVNMYELRIWALKVATLPNPGNNAGTIRTRLLEDLMGPKTLVIDSQSIIARGTRGGLGTNPPQ